MANKVSPQGSGFYMQSTTSYSKIGSLTSIGEFGGSADEMEITTLDSLGGYKEFMGGFRDSGSIALSGLLTNDTADNQDMLKDNFEDGNAVNCYIQVGEVSPNFYTFKAFVQDYKIGAIEVGSPVPFSATLRVSGGFTKTQSAPTSIGMEILPEVPEMQETMTNRRR